MSYRQDRDEFVKRLVQEFPDRPVEDVERLAMRLMRAATTMQRIAETLCSVDVGERRQAELEAEDERTEIRVRLLCEPWGLLPNFNGDPRGAVLKVILPSGAYNSWGGAEAGWCVPAREISPTQWR